MASPRLLRPLPLLLLAGMLSATLTGPATAGPLVRRAQERRACQEFAGKLQQASGNPAMAQQVYQQGVLQLVQRFGENPCGDIPAPTASGAPGAPATSTQATPAPAAAQAASGNPPATAPTGAPATPAASGAAASTTAAPAAMATSPASAQQQQACQQFAGKLQQAAASGGAAAAQQTYAMGLQKLTGMFGANPCPGVSPPR